MFSYTFSIGVPILNYPLIQQHSSNSPLLHYVNTLPCETQHAKLCQNTAAVKLRFSKTAEYWHNCISQL